MMAPDAVAQVVGLRYRRLHAKSVPIHNAERHGASHRNDRRPTMDKRIRFFIGLDVHKDSIAIAAAPNNSREEPRFIGTTGYSIFQVMKALSRSNCAPPELTARPVPSSAPERATREISALAVQPIPM